MRSINEVMIREKDLNALHKILQTHTSQPIEVWIYGSRVAGKAHNASDIDLVLRTQNLTPLPYSELLHLKTEIQQSNIPVLIEINDWARLPLSFHDEINRCYAVIYSNL
jgi:predicted nucleotidyltransferase